MPPPACTTPRDSGLINYLCSGSEKQAAQSWGATEGTAELNDEQAGEAIAQSEQKDAEAEDAEAVSQEPEVKTMSLQDYYAKQQESRAALNATTSVRQVERSNEPVGAEYTKKAEENFVPPSKPEKKPSKARKSKQTLEVSYGAPPEQRSNESRGGGRGHGGERGDRRGGSTRGRGGASRGDGSSRGGQRGGRGGAGGAAPRIDDKNHFPGLGN